MSDAPIGARLFVMNKTTSRRRLFSRRGLVALAFALLLLIPSGIAAVAPSDVLGHGAGATHVATPPFVYPSTLYDDPGLPYGFPNNDTFGYTVESVDQGRWIEPSGNDLSGGANVIVEMGEFARMHMTDLRDDHWVDVVFDARLRLWSDGDGHYEPNNSYVAPSASGPGSPMGAAPTPLCASNHDGSSPPCIGPDDPCPAGEFALMDVYAGTTLVPTGQDVFLRTVYAGQLTNCSGPNASEDHSFTILPDPAYPGEAAGRFHIPKWILGTGSAPSKDCFVRLWFVPAELTLPHYAAGHNASDDGISINITSVMVQLVAPPMVINHGYSPNLDPPTEVLSNQHDLKNNLRAAMAQNFGQDPWEWASSMPDGGIYLNAYDRKQDFRVSAQELAAHVDNAFMAHWTGKLWMQGQSMGGLVTRYYVEALGGAAHVDKLVQTATPNTGSFEPVILNLLMQNFYAQNDGPINTRLGNFFPPLPCPMPSIFMGWKAWWLPPPGNVFTYHCGAPPGRSRMADFELRPAGSLNPVLHQMNAAYFPLRAAGALPPYFSVRAQLETTPGFDGAVSFASASLNGAIPHRTIKAFHEDTPSQPQTAVYFARFFSDLNIDNAYPSWCMVHITRTPHVVDSSVNPGDVVDPTAGPDHVGNLTDNMTIELFNTTKGVVPFDNGTGGPTSSSWGAGDAPLIDNAHVLVTIDAIGAARIAVHTSLDLPALKLSLLAPDGGPAKVSHREESTGWTRLQEFTLDHPIPGVYALAIGPTAYATPFVLIGSWPSEHPLTITTDKAIYKPGGSVKFTATMPGEDSQSDRILHVPSVAGFVGIPLEGGNGTYHAVWRSPLEPGMYPAFVTVEGDSRSGGFARSLTLTVVVDGVAVETVPSAPSIPVSGEERTPTATPSSSTPLVATTSEPVAGKGTPGVGALTLVMSIVVIAILRRRGT